MKRFFACVACILGLLGCSKVTGLADTVNSATYGTYSDAVGRGAFESGWLPREMPRSAENIVEVHNVDSGEMWVRFDDKGVGILGFTKGCVAQPLPRLPDRRRTRRDVPWWPEDLVLENGGRVRAQWALYSCPRMSHGGITHTAGVAVEASTGRVWYWVAK